MKTCVVCNDTMHNKLSWCFKCPTCDYYSSNLQPSIGTDVDGIDELRKSNFKTIIKKLSRFKPLSEITILEVGCSDGWFLRTCRRENIKVTGVEPETTKYTTLKNEGFNVVHGLFPDVLEGSSTKYDVIIFNDVFEHLPNLPVILRAIDTLLADNGILAINLPNSNGVFYKIASILMRIGKLSTYERLWQKSFQSPHVSYFNPKNLSNLVQGRLNYNEQYRGRLAAVKARGLLARIQASNSGYKAYLLWLGILFTIPFLRILPPDISLQFFQKK